MNSARDSGRLKILFLLPFAPRLDSAHGGGRVMAQFLAAISTRHQTALIYLRGPDELPADDLFLSQCELVEEVPRQGTGQTSLQRLFRNFRLLLALIRKKPMWVTDWESKVFARRVQLVAQSWRPDIVQLEFHVMGQYLAVLTGVTAHRVLVEYEPGILAAPYLKAGTDILKRFAFKRDRAAWEKFEASVIRQVQAVVVFTERDRKALAMYRLSTPIHTIPFGTPLWENPLDPQGSLPPKLLFVGNFMHPPNIEAALRLARNIFPRLLKNYPDLVLYIVGAHPPPELKGLSSKQLVITGWVPDLMPYLDRAALLVAPLHSGGGMRVKILEALAAGKAVVATSLAVDGLEVKDGQEIVLAESDDEFVERIAQLLNDPERRVRIAQRARSWAWTNLSWDKAITHYEQMYKLLLDRAEY